MKSFLDTLDKPVVQIGPVGSKYPIADQVVKAVFDFESLSALIVPKELNREVWARVRQLTPAGFSLRPGLGKSWGVWAVLATNDWASAHKDQPEPKAGLILTVA